MGTTPKKTSPSGSMGQEGVHRCVRLSGAIPQKCMDVPGPKFVCARRHGCAGTFQESANDKGAMQFWSAKAKGADFSHQLPCNL
eukprot:1142293-Pelagomonas_calceolata.AAC.3